jgi:hypothetical protein
MATVKKGMLTPAPEWWKHLREAKRAFWKGERSAAKRLAREEAVPQKLSSEVIVIDGVDRTENQEISKQIPSRSIPWDGDRTLRNDK